jgi:prolipoprotein diacylglyceryltransferase
LFGRPTNKPWGLEIAFDNRPAGFKDFATFHPTFLYEAVWNLGVIALLLLVDRRFKLGHGRAFFLYVAAYTAGRAWIENMRIDTVNHFLGLRLNVWTALILFVLAVVAFVVSARKRPGQEDIATGPAAAGRDPEQQAEPQDEDAADKPANAEDAKDAEDAEDAEDKVEAGSTNGSAKAEPNDGSSD